MKIRAASEVKPAEASTAGIASVTRRDQNSTLGARKPSGSRLDTRVFAASGKIGRVTNDGSPSRQGSNEIFEAIGCVSSPTNTSSLRQEGFRPSPLLLSGE